MPLKIKGTSTVYVSEKKVKDAARDMLDGGGTVTAVDVASTLFPALVEYVQLVLETNSEFRLADNQDHIPLGIRFTLN